MGYAHAPGRGGDDGVGDAGGIVPVCTDAPDIINISPAHRWGPVFEERHSHSHTVVPVVARFVT